MSGDGTLYKVDFFPEAGPEGCSDIKAAATASSSDTSSNEMILYHDVTTYSEITKRFIERRGYLYLDTTNIPAGSVILSATLSLYITHQSATAGIGPGLNVLNGQPTYPSESGGSPNLQLSDFGESYYSSVGALAAADVYAGGVGKYYAITISPSAVTVNGLTKLCAINSLVCLVGTDQYAQISFYATDKGADYRPKIEVTYASPSAGTPLPLINIGDSWVQPTAALINIGDAWVDASDILVNLADEWVEPTG